MSVLTACSLGPTSYRDGLRLQEAVLEARARGATGDWLLFPDHPPVLTVGRGASGDALRVDRAHLAARGIELHEVSRGGDITWHGPGQLVGYPIIDLGRCDRDLHRYLRALEGSLIDALASYGVHGERVAGRTGVWVDGEKIASIGIAVRKWVSYHGFALNVAPDLAAFDLIHPCGLRGIRMTSLAARLGENTPVFAEVRDRVAGCLAARLDYEGVVWGDPGALPAPGLDSATSSEPEEKSLAC
mgnify:CR=1 FL=1